MVVAHLNFITFVNPRNEVTGSGGAVVLLLLEVREMATVMEFHRSAKDYGGCERAVCVAWNIR